MTDATNEEQQEFISALTADPSLLYREAEKTKQTLMKILQSTFSSYVKARGTGKQRRNHVKALALKGFGLDQIWAQIEHHTTSVNEKLINQLTALMADEDFLRNALAQSTDDEIDGESETSDAGAAGDSDGEAGLDAEYGSEAEADPEDQDYAFEKEGKKNVLDLEQERDKGGIFDKGTSDSEVEEYMEGLENEEMDLDGLKLPSDAEEDDLDVDDDEDGPGLFNEYDDEEDFGKGVVPEDDSDEGRARGNDADDEDGEDEIEDVFNMANENKEMDVVENLRRQADEAKDDQSAAGYINADLVKKIEQIEDEMMNPKPWQLMGEAKNSERPVNSLLDVHLDFNAATKLPPTITKEVTIKIEELIKQRVLDELFDDPVLLNENRRRKLNSKEIEMDFTKSKKGLGDLYAEDMANKLLSANPEAFLEEQLKGPDAPLKREIEEISKDLF